MSRWARFFTRRKRMMEDLDQDIRDYIERETQDNIERGMSPEEAHYAALRKFGNVTRVKEDTWEVWGFVWLEQLWQDIRFGLRMLAKNPASRRWRFSLWPWALAPTVRFSVFYMRRFFVRCPMTMPTGLSTSTEPTATQARYEVSGLNSSIGKGRPRHFRRWQSPIFMTR